MVVPPRPAGTEPLTLEHDTSRCQQDAPVSITRGVRNPPQSVDVITRITRFALTGVMRLATETGERGRTRTTQCLSRREQSK